MAIFFISISTRYKGIYIARVHPLFIEYIVILKPDSLWKCLFLKYYRLMPAKGSLLQVSVLQHVP